MELVAQFATSCDGSLGRRKHGGESSCHCVVAWSRSSGDVAVSWRCMVSCRDAKSGLRRADIDEAATR